MAPVPRPDEPVRCGPDADPTRRPACATTIPAGIQRGTGETELEALREVEDRVLWLATAIIHHANRVRPNPSGLKVGGHQASSRLDGVDHDRAVVPARCAPRTGSRSSRTPRRCCTPSTTCSASSTPRYLTTLREFGGLQSYPSRSKDPDPVDYSTGSVGIGATAPIWGAIARRYVARPIGARRDRGRAAVLAGRRRRARRGRRLGGGARPDGRRARRGRLDRRPQPAVAGPGRARHRAPTGCRACSPPPAGRCSRSSTAACSRSCSPAPGGDALRARIDAMTNPEYQRLLRCTAAAAARAPARRRPEHATRDRRAARRPRRRRPARRHPQPRRPRPRRAARRLRPRSTTPGRP